WKKRRGTQKSIESFGFMQSAERHRERRIVRRAESCPVERRCIGEERKVGNEMHALPAPPPFDDIAHEIGRLPQEMIAAPEISQAVVAAQPADERAIPFWHEGGRTPRKS